METIANRTQRADVGTHGAICPFMCSQAATFSPSSVAALSLLNGRLVAAIRVIESLSISLLLTCPALA